MWKLFKSREVVITNKQNLIDTLSSIAEILKDNEYYGQAEAIKKPMEFLLEDDKENFLKHLKTVDIWGGSGAAWEVGQFKSERQEKEFQRHFIRLSQLLYETGIKFRPASQIANIFERDLNRSE